jgi:hypothetical protein
MIRANYYLASCFIAMRKHLPIICLFIVAFFLRLFFGLSYEFWFDDNLQVYLIGLKWYTSGLWPYWGPDVVASHSAIPGALQGVLTGGPFFLWLIPEAPHILLNLLSLATLAMFGWYLSKRLTGTPKALIYLWLVTMPSAMHYSTIVQNPSYVLLFSIPFFIAVFELFPLYEQNILSRKLCFYFLGLAIPAIYQLHLSWVLLLPFVMAVFYFDIRKKNNLQRNLSNLCFFTLGLVTTFLFLLPTLIKYGVLTGEALGANTRFNFHNILAVFAIIQDFFTYPVYNLEQFMPNRAIESGLVIDILQNYFWLVPFILFLFIIRIWQYILLAVSFWKFRAEAQWRKRHALVFFSLLILWFSFLFTEHWPNVHKYYLIMPVATWYAAHVFDQFLVKKSKRIVYIIIISTVVFYLGLLLIYTGYNRSLYNNRHLVVKALTEKDYSLLGKRREQSKMMQLRQDIWKRALTTDTLHYSTTFEYDDPYNLPQNILNSKAHSGIYSCKVDSVQPFSLSKKISGAEVGERNTLEIVFWLYCDSPPESALVIDIHDDQGSIYWYGMQMKNLQKTVPGWNRFTYSMKLPVDGKIRQPDSVASVYVAHRRNDDEVVYIDDITIKLF